MKTLKSRLQKKVEPCYVVQGEDLLLYDKALELVKKACNLEMEDFNFLTFDEDSFDAAAVIASLDTLPIGCNKKLILLKNITKFSDSFKKDLIEYLKNPTSTTCLVIFDFFNKFDFLISEKISAKRMDERILSELIASALKEHGKTIESKACKDLIEYCCGYYSLIANELQKLIFCEEQNITEKTIKENVCKETEFSVFELTDALSKKDANKAVNLLHLMEKDTKTFSLIQNHFRRLFFASLSDLPDKELSSLLGVKEYAIVKARELSKTFSKIQLKNIYELLGEVDFLVKNGGMQIENALFYLIFGILYC